MKNLKEFVAFLIGSLLIFGLSFPMMLTAFSIPNPKMIYLPIVLFSLVSLGIKDYWVKVPLYIVGTVVSLYFSATVSQAPSMLLLVKHGRSFFEQFNSTERFVYPLALTYFFILIFLVILVEAFCVGQNIISVSIIVICYLMFLSIFNDIVIAPQIMFILSLMFLLNFLQETQYKSLKVSLVSVLILSVVFIFSLLIPTTFMEKEVVKVATPYRNFLTGKGFYTAISNYKYGVASSTGYSEDDSVLGGALRDDETVKFKVIQENPHYWRLGTRDIYTGKGWELSAPNNLERVNFDEGFALENGKINRPESEEIELTFSYSDKYVPVTYGKTIIDRMNANNRFVYDQKTGRLELENNYNLNTIKMSVENMDIPEESLRKTPTVYPYSNHRYLELPENFPTKIGNLSEKLTKDKTTNYDKILAIQTYLKDPSIFSYSKKEVPFPRENQDYVEQFLFETKVGYCDNFSTAMAVMLRSIDIPTRWVKGFSTGSIDKKLGDKDLYVIRNLDAHSWVEVYFEDIGWVPFEPTPSFYQVRQAKKEDKTTKKDNQDVGNKKNETAKKEDEKEQKTPTSNSSESVNPNQTKKLSLKKYAKYFITFIVISGLVMSYFLWKYWLYVYALLAFKYNQATGSQIYQKLLKKVERRYQRGQEKPLIDYAYEAEMEYPYIAPSFSELTKLYEIEIYTGEEVFNRSHQELLLKVIKSLIQNK
ncbi:transglutaminase-like domain-containing protein [Vagococcus hydrophili]|uniref:Transglutaminase domain-containing protein n=1 Tax=Vagococcus hydrophili TaxID=2714947 RepID=A0A6G8AUH2_9ENTE|nr:transglutaminase-like domain-containing protein [Vagococcus hydrophili]QIL48718.1 transglutaminase domain-containing protein [Vagococcus hydrophili]